MFQKGHALFLQCRKKFFLLYVFHSSLPEPWEPKVDARRRPCRKIKGDLVYRLIQLVSLWLRLILAFLFVCGGSFPACSQKVCNFQHHLICSFCEWQIRVSPQYWMYFASGACGSARLLINIVSCSNLAPFSPSCLSSCLAFPFACLCLTLFPFSLIERILPSCSLNFWRFSPKRFSDVLGWSC